MIDLNSDGFRDKVMGCWMGKNCGGTLGGPLEKAYGEEEPFDISWYPELEPGGIPNDDLEIQLIWLKAVEECGLDITAYDLSQYWLDHIMYNPDEYGLHKTHLRLGLRPPVSGAYNNWFKNCMGCPIRTEVWACIAPGVPGKAVQFAYEDSICDHAGGESVYGSFFNAAMESAAFIESDLRTLINIGRTYVPDGTETALAVDTVLKAYEEGCEWKEARKRLLRATPHYVAQYSPINMGIQVIGLLYGEDFGDTLCLTVNCGYDTDCTGATVGSILGIVNGLSGLPEKWTEPLGMNIVTSERSGGLRHVSDVSNPIPSNLDGLTDRVIALARQVLAREEMSPAGFEADEAVFSIFKRPVMTVSFTDPVLDTDIDYGESPVIVPGESRTVAAVLKNRHPEPLDVSCTLRAPDGWTADLSETSLQVPGRGEKTVECTVCAEQKDIENSNRLTLELSAGRRPDICSVPVTLVGARALQVSGPYTAEGANLLDTEFPPETEAGEGEWSTVYADGNALPEQYLSGPGAVYFRAFLEMPQARTIWMGLPATAPTRVWINGTNIIDCAEPRLLRPNNRGDGMSYAEAELTRGYNEVLIKCAVGDTPAQAHLVLSEGKETRFNGLIDAGWTRIPQ